MPNTNLVSNFWINIKLICVCVPGNWLWVCQESQGTDVDTMWNARIPRTRDHPLKGITLRLKFHNYLPSSVVKLTSWFNFYSLLYFFLYYIVCVLCCNCSLLCSGLQQGSGLVGLGGAGLWNGCRLPSILCWSAHPDIRKNCIRKGNVFHRVVMNYLERFCTAQYGSLAFSL